MDKKDPLENYKKRLKAVFEIDGSHPVKNLKIVQDYLDDVELKSKSDYTTGNNYASLIVFCEACTTPIPDLTVRDVKNFAMYLKNHTYKLGKNDEEKSYSPHTRRVHKVMANKFFKWLKRDDLIKEMKEYMTADKTKEENPKRAKQNLLTEEEVYKKLIPRARNSRDKALISVFYECGARRGEALRCNIGHVDFAGDRHGCLLTIPDGKNGKRPEPIVLVLSRIYLRNWIDDHPMRDKDGNPDMHAPLFVTSHMKTIRDKKTGEVKKVYTRLTEGALTKQMKALGDRAEIGKPCSPHQYRHACATYLAEEGMNTYQLNTVLGWSNKTDTAAGYVHDVSARKKMKEIRGIKDEEEEPKEKTRICYNCKQRIDIYANFCPNCGYGNDTARGEINEKYARIYQKFRKIARNHPEIQELYDKLDDEEEDEEEQKKD